MKSLSDSLLLETYLKSIELDLDANFIMLLRIEIERRNLAERLTEQ